VVSLAQIAKHPVVENTEGANSQCIENKELYASYKTIFNTNTPTN